LRLVSNPLSKVLAALVLLGAATAMLPAWLERSGRLDKSSPSRGDDS
jgi:putative tricarboxylic transport membrane protein